jgi:hypothetical protein
MTDELGETETAAGESPPPTRLSARVPAVGLIARRSASSCAAPVIIRSRQNDRPRPTHKSNGLGRFSRSRAPQRASDGLRAGHVIELCSGPDFEPHARTYGLLACCGPRARAAAVVLLLLHESSRAHAMQRSGVTANVARRSDVAVPQILRSSARSA